jgi:hypothetical protein
MSTARDTNVDFPKIHYFQTKKVNLAENLLEMISAQKEQKKAEIISDQLQQDSEYKTFVKDCKNPALGPKYMKERYIKYYNKYFVIP